MFLIGEALFQPGDPFTQAVEARGDDVGDRRGRRLVVAVDNSSRMVIAAAKEHTSMLTTRPNQAVDKVGR